MNSIKNVKLFIELQFLVKELNLNIDCYKIYIERVKKP